MFDENGRKKCKKRDFFSENIRGNREKDTRKQGKKHDVTGREKALRQIRAAALIYQSVRPDMCEWTVETDFYSLEADNMQYKTKV